MCNAPVLMDGKIKLSYCKQSLLKVEFGTMQFVLDLPMFEIDGIERSNTRSSVSAQNSLASRLVATANMY